MRRNHERDQAWHTEADDAEDALANEYGGPAGTRTPGKRALTEFGVAQFRRGASPADSSSSVPDGDGSRSLPDDVRERMEYAFGADFSAVRVRESGEAAAVGAEAMTRGHSITFAPGHLDLDSERGLALLGHELTHVVQQAQGRVPVTRQAKGLAANEDPALEREADDLGARAARGERVATAGNVGASGAGVAQFRRLVGRSSPESVTIVQEVLSGDNVTAMRALLRAMRQIASRRIESGTEQILCVAGGDSFDLTLTQEDSDELQRALDRRIGQLQTAARAAAVAGPADDAAGGTSSFANAFNTEFRDILPALRQASRDSSGEDDRSPTFADLELRLMFTPDQRTKLSQFFATHVIPDRLFDGDDAGGCNAQQRIVISGHILSHGTYQPGSFSQRLHARMCGHWAQLVHNYAGVARTGAEGVQQDFNHEGDLVLGGGGSEGVYAGAQEQLDPSERTGQRLFRRQGMPFSEFDRIQPGDWLYIHTGVDTAGGDHSVVFSHWLDTEPQGAEGARYRRAITFDQSSPDQGGRQHTRYLGEARGTAAGNPIYPITMARRYDEDARPPETPDDLIEHDLGLDVDPEQRREELMPELGTGPAARRNFDFILRLERRHRGRIQLQAVKERIRAANAAMIDRINPQSSDDGEAPRERAEEGQLDQLRAVNERNDLETLIRLNERLNNLLHNIQALEGAEEAQEERYESQERRDAREVAAQRRAELEQDIAEVDGEIARASEVLSLDEQIRSLEREKRSLRRSLEWRRGLVRRARGAARERFERIVHELETRLREIDEEELPPLVEARATAAATEEAGRTSTGLGRGLSIRQLRNRLQARRTRLEREIASVEADAGYYTAHPGSRDVFLGRRDGQREPRLTGRLENVRPDLPWAELITAGQPGAAAEVQQRRRQTERERRASRRSRRH